MSSFQKARNVLLGKLSAVGLAVSHGKVDATQVTSALMSVIVVLDSIMEGEPEEAQPKVKRKAKKSPKKDS